MKALKIILALVYVILITLLFLFSCKGCQKGNSKDMENDEEETEIIDEREDSIVDEEEEPEIEEEEPIIEEQEPIEVTDSINEEDQEIIDEANDIGETGDLKITLLWDYKADMDLHVLEPSGFHIYHAKKNSPSGGHLDIDNISGGTNSAENIYWQNPPSGSYRVFVRYYSPAGPMPSDCKVVVQQLNREPKVYDLHFSRYKEDIYIPDVLVN